MGSERSSQSHKALYGIAKLTGENYLGWVYNVTQVLKEYKVWKIVTGDDTKPSIAPKSDTADDHDTEEAGASLSTSPITHKDADFWVEGEKTRRRAFEL